MEMKLQLLAGTHAARADTSPLAHTSRLALRRTRAASPHALTAPALPAVRAEDVSIALEEQSEGALRRLPRAGAEVSRVDVDARALAAAVGGVLTRLEAASAASAAGVASLASLDGAARRIETARGTLAEAAGLADLLDRSAELLASGDVRAIADALAAMRRALAVVGGVPEFAEGAARVAALTDALEQLVQPALGSALAARDGGRTREMVDVLCAAGREGALQRVYVAARLQPLLTAWEEGSSAGLAALLPAFYDAVLGCVEAEARWCADALPEHHPALLLALLSELHARTSKTYASRLASAVAPPGAASAAAVAAAAGASAAAAAAAAPRSAALPALIPLHASAASFGRALARLLAGAPPASLRPVLEAATRPFEPYRASYGDAERRHLGADLSKLDLRDGGGLTAVVRRMALSVPLAAEAVEAAAARCVALTGGSEADALLRAADDALLSYLTSLHALLRRQRAALGLAASAADAASAAGAAAAAAAGAEDGGAAAAAAAATAAAAAAATAAALGGGFADDTIHAALELLPLGAALLSRLSLLEAHLRGVLAEASVRLAPALPPADADPAAASAGGAAPAVAAASADAAAAARDAALVSTADAAALRVAALPERGRRLSALFATSAAARFAPLPHAAPRAAALADAAADFVYDVLMARVTAALRGVAALPAWAATSASTSSSSGGDDSAMFALPIFSASPAEHVTAVGEYLLTLPQLVRGVSCSVLFCVGRHACAFGQLRERGHLRLHPLLLTGRNARTRLPACSWRLSMRRPRRAAHAAPPASPPSPQTPPPPPPPRMAAAPISPTLTYPTHPATTAMMMRMAPAPLRALPRRGLSKCHSGQRERMQLRCCPFVR
jgi:hypothetical protein